MAKAGIVPLFYGAQGKGKTESMRQLAESMGYRFVSLRLGQLTDSGDLTGLPDFSTLEVNGQEVKVTDFMQPKFLPVAGEKVFLFLDEVNRTPNDIIQAVFQLVERNGGIGEYKLDFTKDPETGLPNTIRAAACNPPTDDFVVQDFDDLAWQDRFVHIKFEPTVAEFLDYMDSKGVHGSITHFLRSQPTMIEVESKDFNLNHVKPSRRSWESVAKVIEQAEGVDRAVINEICCGLVGVEAYTAYQSSRKNYDLVLKGTDVLDKFDEVKSNIPFDRTDLISKINLEILEELKQDNVTKERGLNLIKYLNKIPKDMGVSFFQTTLETMVKVVKDDKEVEEPVVSQPNVLKHFFDFEVDAADQHIEDEFVKIYGEALKPNQEKEDEK